MAELEVVRESTYIIDFDGCGRHWRLCTGSIRVFCSLLGGEAWVLSNLVRFAEFRKLQWENNS